MIVSVYSVKSDSNLLLYKRTFGREHMFTREWKETDNSLTLTTCFAGFSAQNETSNIAYCSLKEFFRLTKDFYCWITFDVGNVLTKQLL